MAQNGKKLFTKQSRFDRIKHVGKRIRNKATSIIDSHPLASFFGFLLLIVVVIAVGDFLRKPAATTEAKQPVKNVSVFSIGKAPRIQFSGKVEKTGALKITALSGGIVQSINKWEGSKVSRGQTLFTLSTNYQGGNLPAVSRQIAEASLKAAEDNYPVQKDTITKRRDNANDTDTQADDLRNITNDSIQATKDQISFNQSLLDSINSQISYVQANGADANTLLQLNQSKSSVMSALASLNNAQRQAEYNAGSGNAPASLSDRNRDLTKEQLNIEERSLDLSLEIAHLNLRIAQISEALMYPGAPVNGVLERVYVSVGQTVTPGQLLATMVGDKNVANVTVLVSSDIAKQLSRLETSTIAVGSTSAEIMPRYISKEPTDGSLHSVIFTLPEDVGALLTNGTSVSVEMPIGNAQSTASVPYVPLDAVFQTQTSSIVYVATSSAQGQFTVEGRDVNLGQVFGSYVEVQKGLSASDQVVLNRDVLAGDAVVIAN